MTDGRNGPRALIGRDAELAELVESLRLARSGRGGVVLLDGPPGIGRTSLMERLVADPAAEGCRVLWARGCRYEREFSLGVVRQLLEPVLSGADEADREHLLAGAGRLASDALSPDSLESVGEPGFAMLHGLYWLLVNLSRRGPVLLMVDDAHWADRSSLRWLAYLAGRLSGLPVLVVLSRRGGQVPVCAEVWSALAPVCRLVPVHPLGHHGVAALASRLPGGVADPELGAVCHALTGGNPQLVTTLLECLARCRRARVSEVDTVGRCAERVLPGALLSWLRALPEDCQRFAGALAILGEGAEHDSVAEVAGLELPAADQAARLLAEAGLLQDGPVLAFASGWVAETVAAGLTPGERARADAAAARVLFDAGADVQRVARHLLGAAPEGLAWRVSVLRQAADALARKDPARAGAWRRRALGECSTGHDGVGEVLEAMAGADLWVDPDESTATVVALTEHLDARERPGLYARATVVLSQSLAVAGRLGEACAVLEWASGEVRDRESRLLLSAKRLLVDPATAADAGELAGDTPGERAVLAVRAFQFAAAGQTAEPVRLARLVLRRGSAGEATVFPTVALAGAALVYSDHVAEAVGWLEAAGGGTRALPDLRVAQTLVEAYLRCGLLAKAVTLAESLIVPADRHDPLTVSRLAEGFLLQGNHEQALEVLARYPVHDADHAWGLPRMLLARGRVLLETGRAKESVAVLTGIGQLLAGRGADHPSVANWRSLAALGYDRLGDHEQARELSLAELEITRSGDRARCLGVSLRIAGAVTPGAAGLALLRDSIDPLADSSAHLELAHALVDLGVAENVAGSSARARQTLRRGVEQAQSCGATALARRGHEELRRAGGRPRGRYLIGVQALTMAERRVAGLARSGRTNREISRQLCVTQRTVELHLSNAYRKLGISQRDELAHAFAS